MLCGASPTEEFTEHKKKTFICPIIDIAAMDKEISEIIIKAVMDGSEDAARKAAEEALKANVEPLDAIKNGFAKGMEIIGKKFSTFEIFLPEVLLAADAVKAGIAVLTPHITAGKMKEILKGKVVIGTVWGDIHDIGKNIVATMLEVAGFAIHDLGGDVRVKDFVRKAEEVKADIIAMSCLLSPSMFYQKDVIDYLKAANTRDKYYIIIGGGPITPEWAVEIGADGWGKYADDGVVICKRFVEEAPQRPLPNPICVGV